MNRKIICILSVLLFILINYLYYQNNYVVITRYVIQSKKLPKSFRGYKIIQLSDIHNTKSNRIANKIKKIVETEKPDIVVITGDIIGTNPKNFNGALRIVNYIKEYATIYYVPGNHEALSSNYEKLRKMLINEGVIVLENEVLKIENGGEAINLIGVKDPDFYSTSNSYTMNNLLEEIIYDDSLYSILLSHRPELFDIYVKNNLDLVFTGHAHGGQIRIPLIGGVIAPNQGLFPKYTNGVFNENNTSMVVNRGIGNSVLPFRINNRPEVVIVTLERK